MNPFLSVFCEIWEKEWSELSINEKADFCSYKKIPFLNNEIEFLVITMYNNERQEYFEMLD